MTVEQAKEILERECPPDVSLHDEEELETYFYGPDDPVEYFAKIETADELKKDFEAFLDTYERG